MAVKVIMLGVFVGATDTLVSPPGGIWGTIVTIGAVIGALAIIWAKGVRPGIRFGRQIGEAIEIIRALPGQQERLEEWKDRVEGRLDALEGAPGTKPGHGLAHQHET